MGCPKNTVDTEASLGFLHRSGAQFVEHAEDADVIIVSACSFLDSAWTETVEEVERLAELKRQGHPKKLILMGCLPLHRKDAWRESLPQVDHFIPAGGQSILPTIIESLSAAKGSAGAVPTAGLDQFAGFENRVRMTPAHTAWVKIAEGCSRPCAFCAIPTIRGNMESRPVDSIVREVEGLRDEGVKEVSLLAQDITSYHDGRRRFPDMVDAVAATGIDWIRIFYVHPGSLTRETAGRLFEHPAVCRYLESPIQHVSDRLLDRMGRYYTRRHIEEVFGAIRNDYPDVVIRSEVIVGYPGETDEEFDALKEFVSGIGFASLGVFPYSPEPGTRAADLSEAVPEDLRMERAEEIIAVQQSVSFGFLSALKGADLRILVDRELDDASPPPSYPDCGFAGRYYGQALEIDGEVYLKGKGVEVGEFVGAKVTDADAFDLEAEVLNT
jgi:ribosomal protein S12 methylthiotransferase